MNVTLYETTGSRITTTGDTAGRGHEAPPVRDWFHEDVCAVFRADGTTAIVLRGQRHGAGRIDQFYAVLHPEADELPLSEPTTVRAEQHSTARSTHAGSRQTTAGGPEWLRATIREVADIDIVAHGERFAEVHRKVFESGAWPGDEAMLQVLGTELEPEAPVVWTTGRVSTAVIAGRIASEQLSTGEVLVTAGEQDLGWQSTPTVVIRVDSASPSTAVRPTDATKAAIDEARLTAFQQAVAHEADKLVETTKFDRARIWRALLSAWPERPAVTQRLISRLR
ncbi:hypothetical protein RYH80_15385 [Halobaculum sp. MBLA0147]|uniref:hypothetical protein n=1 Tax=Halobaculum sp. MBLA0147 TaxID=3079934 RepID=UPI0035265651